MTACVINLNYYAKVKNHQYVNYNIEHEFRDIINSSESCKKGHNFAKTRLSAEYHFYNMKRIWLYVPVIFFNNQSQDTKREEEKKKEVII